MIYICDTCEEIHFQDADLCPDCEAGQVLRYDLYLEPDLVVLFKDFTYAVGRTPYAILREMFLEKYSDLAYRRLYHTVRYQLGLLEHKMILDIPYESLPLHINYEWCTDIGAETFHYRLGACPEVEYPDKHYYASRYFDDSDLT